MREEKRGRSAEIILSGERHKKKGEIYTKEN